MSDRTIVIRYAIDRPPAAPDRFRELAEQGRWKAYAVELVDSADADAIDRSNFEVCWLVWGRSIREQVADDPLLVRLLRQLLPRYDGPAMELFRGENRDRWMAGCIGLAWTPDIEVARRFGRGRNAMGSGGVLLRARFEPEAVICGPNHQYLGGEEEQVTVDPSAASDLVLLEEFPTSLPG